MSALFFDRKGSFLNNAPHFVYDKLKISHRVSVREVNSRSLYRLAKSDGQVGRIPVGTKPRSSGRRAAFADGATDAFDEPADPAAGLRMSG